MPLELSFGDAPEMADHRERYVREGDADELTLPGPRAMPIGGQQAGRGESAHDRVPRRKHAVQRLGVVPRTGGPGEPGGWVDRVVDLRGPVAIAGERDHHQVRPAARQ